ncbi:hypothetical protein BKA62DRAFT_222913 [Auriculariales sp. MPI-PUGE-AT-0066]|nr:hypothetical protein BKA62DRAFT_222913 [Auriculariales sp. MPI-PUGE-AT-0066]
MLPSHLDNILRAAVSDVFAELADPVSNHLVVEELVEAVLKSTKTVARNLAHGWNLRRSTICMVLPPELLVACAERLVLLDRHRIVGVSRSWYTALSAAPHLWQEVALEYHEYVSVSEGGNSWLDQQIHKENQRLELYLQTMLKRSGALTIQLRWSSKRETKVVEMNDPLARILLPHAGRVERVVLEQVRLADGLWDMIPNLRSLKYGRNHRYYDHHLRFRHLRTLEVDASFQLFDESSRILRNPSMREFKCRNYRGNVSDIFEIFPRLESLHVEVSFSTWPAGCAPPPALRRLTLTRNHDIRDTSIDFDGAVANWPASMLHFITVRHTLSIFAVMRLLGCPGDVTWRLRYMHGILSCFSMDGLREGHCYVPVTEDLAGVDPLWAAARELILHAAYIRQFFGAPWFQSIIGSQAARGPHSDGVTIDTLVLQDGFNKNYAHSALDPNEPVFFEIRRVVLVRTIAKTTTYNTSADGFDIEVETATRAVVDLVRQELAHFVRSISELVLVNFPDDCLCGNRSMDIRSLAKSVTLLPLRLIHLSWRSA